MTAIDAFLFNYVDTGINNEEYYDSCLSGGQSSDTCKSIYWDGSFCLLKEYVNVCGDGTVLANIELFDASTCFVTRCGDLHKRITKDFNGNNCFYSDCDDLKACTPEDTDGRNWHTGEPNWNCWFMCRCESRNRCSTQNLLIDLPTDVLGLENHQNKLIGLPRDSLVFERRYSLFIDTPIDFRDLFMNRLIAWVGLERQQDLFMRTSTFCNCWGNPIKTKTMTNNTTANNNTNTTTKITITSTSTSNTVNITTRTTTTRTSVIASSITIFSSAITTNATVIIRPKSDVKANKSRHPTTITRTFSRPTTTDTATATRITTVTTTCVHTFAFDYYDHHNHYHNSHDHHDEYRNKSKHTTITTTTSSSEKKSVQRHLN